MHLHIFRKMSSTSFGSTVLLDAGYIFFFVIWFISIVFLIIFLFYNSTHIVMQLVTICWSTTHSTSNAQTALFPLCVHPKGWMLQWKFFLSVVRYTVMDIVFVYCGCCLGKMVPWNALPSALCNAPYRALHATAVLYFIVCSLKQKIPFTFETQWILESLSHPF